MAYSAPRSSSIQQVIMGIQSALHVTATTFVNILSLDLTPSVDYDWTKYNSQIGDISITNKMMSSIKFSAKNPTFYDLGLVFASYCGNYSYGAYGYAYMFGSAYTPPTPFYLTIQIGDSNYCAQFGNAYVSNFSLKFDVNGDCDLSGEIIAEIPTSVTKHASSPPPSSVLVTSRTLDVDYGMDTFSPYSFNLSCSNHWGQIWDVYGFAGVVETIPQIKASASMEYNSIINNMIVTNPGTNNLDIILSAGSTAAYITFMMLVTGITEIGDNSGIYAATLEFEGMCPDDGYYINGGITP